MAIYHFLIDRRTLWGLIAAGTLVGALLFFAGLLVGLHQNLPAPAAQARTDGVQTAAVPATAGAITAPSASGPSVSGPAATGASAPTVRVQTSTTSPPSASVSGPHIRRPVVRRPVVRRPTVRRPALTSAPRSATTSVTPPPGPGAAAAQGTGGGSVAEASEGSAPHPDAAEPPAPETAGPAPETVVASTPATEEQEHVTPPPLPPPPLPTAFSIQVGAYRETRYLEAALEDLKSRGYSPYVVPVSGSGGLIFRTIRIGRYRTRDEAIRAAAEFGHRESMTALVRGVTPEMHLSHLPDEPPTEEPPPFVGL